MNRRDLLQLFGFAGIAAMLPKGDVREVEIDRGQAWRMTAFAAMVTADPTRWGIPPVPMTAGISRGHDVVLQFALSPYSDIHWRSSDIFRRDEIVVPAGGEMLNVWASDPSRVNVSCLMRGEHGATGLLTLDGFKQFA